jgi:nucleolar protein 15
MSKILQNLAATRKRASELGEDQNEASERSQKKIKLLKKPNVPVPTSKSKSKTALSDGSSVVYLGHIAHGFYEQEIRKFFSQFGKVQKLKLVRSKKTGGSRGHAFIQFETPEIAEVVASTIDGYFLHEKQLVCNIVPQSKIHVGLFALPRKLKKSEETKEIEETNETEVIPESTAISQKKLSRLTRLQSRKQNRLRELGIEFDFLSAQQIE